MNTCETDTLVRQPAFTSRENEDGLQIQVALPGIAKEDLKLTVKQSVLHIEATRPNAVPADWQNHSGSPRPVSYQLNARIAQKFDGAGAKASLENGVLTLDIPIREDAKPREISVN